MMNTAMIVSYRVDSLRNGKVESKRYAGETDALAWFNYMADTGHAAELVRIDDKGHAHLIDEYHP